MKIFSVFDVKAGHFQNPFPDTSAVSALRGFGIAAAESKSVLSAYPDDFALVELAEFDKSTGKITPHANPLNLGTARSVMQSSPQSVEAAESFRQ